METMVRSGWTDRHDDVALTWFTGAIESLSVLPAEAVATTVGDVWRNRRATATFGELLARSRGVAEAVCSRGSRVGDVVAVVGRRGEPMLVAATVGVWLAGCSPLMVGLSNPPARIRTMLSTTHCAAAIVCGQVCAPAVAAATDVVGAGNVVEMRWDGGGPSSPSAGAGVATIDGLAPGHRPHAPAVDPPNHAVSTAASDCDAYVLFTSGSTSEPKACRGAMTGLINRCRGVNTLLPPGPDEVTLARVAVGFVDSIAEIFGALSAGIAVVLCPEVWADHPGGLVALSAVSNATRLTLVPVLLDAVLATMLQDPRLKVQLRTVCSSGAPLQRSTVARFHRALGLPPDTRLVNLWGLTEVCGDATLHVCAEIDGDPAQVGAVPIGMPLPGVTVRVGTDRGQSGVAAQPGTVGELCIAGSCVGRGYLSAPTLTAASFDRQGWFHTGDLGYQREEDGCFVLTGRADRVVCMGGYRVDLAELELLVSQMEVVARCVAVPTGGRIDDGSCTAVAVHVVRADPFADDCVVEAAVRLHVQERLPPHMTPSTVHVHDRIPVNAHGKFDFRALELLPSPPSPPVEHPSPSALGWSLLACILTGEGLGDGALPHMTLVEIGGDSVIALRIARDLVRGSESDTGTESGRDFGAAVLYALLDQSLGHVALLLVPEHPALPTRHTDRAKRRRVASKGPHSEQRDFGAPSSSVHWAVDRRTMHRCEGGPGGCISGSIQLQCRWAVPLGKCIDASPLVVAPTQGNDPAMVFIGSHSNRFVAANAATGAVLWEHETADRIEASAALSVCGNYISVGSFDGALYVLSIADGTVAWRYQTDDVVKSCPAVQPASDLMVFGSHDGLLHAIDVTRREPVWVYRLSPPEGDRGGRVATGPSPLSAPPAIFSSPAIDQVRDRVVAADLAGVVVCLALATPPTAANGSPVLLWRRVLKNPVFSSIAITPSGHIIVATVGAEVLCLDGECGEILWVFLTKGPVFSSPFIDPGTNSLFIGCHDHHVYRLDLDRGIQVWAADLGEKVYASPHGLCLANGALAVVCASTCGLVALLDGVTGATSETLQLPGEVFSSPVCCHASKRIYIGCRDDHLYCLDVVVTTTGQTALCETPESDVTK